MLFICSALHQMLSSIVDKMLEKTQQECNVCFQLIINRTAFQTNIYCSLKALNVKMTSM